jgi:dTDP-4-dehydrorhamnose reductase
LKVLVTGGSSTPGFRITQEFAKAGYKVIAQYNEHEIPEIEGVEKVKVDFRDYSKLVDLINSVKPDIIIHTAALGDVDKCESDRELAWKVNVDATLILVKEALKHNAYFLYLSTDYVFDGERGLYREEDIPNPINYYGLTKLIAESIVRSALSRYSIVRTSHIYGFGMGRINFARAVVESLSKGQKVRALVDQWLSPTLNTLLAKAVRELVEMEYVGVIHVAGVRVSRYDFAKAIARKFGFNEGLIEPITMKDIQFKARRPRDSSLDVSKARKLLKTDFYTLENSLNVFHSEWLVLRGVR